MNRDGKHFSQIKQLVQHSAIYAISTAIQRLQGLILLPVYTSFTYIPSRAEFGNYVLIYTFIAFMNFFYLYGMDSALLRYFFLGNAPRKTVFSTAFYTLFISSLLTTLLILGFSRPLSELILETPQLSLYLQLAGLILFFDTLVNLPFVILRAEEKPVQFTIFRVLRFATELVLNLVFVVYLKKGVLGILYANLLAAGINLIFMLPVLKRYLSRKIDTTLWRQMVLFGLPFLPNGIAYMTVEMVDRFLVQGILGKDAVGLYGANYKFGTILLLLIVAFRNAWQPFFLKIAPQKDAPQVYAKVLTYFVMAGSFLVLLGTFFIKDVLTIHYFGRFYILGPNYWDGILIIPLILLAYFFFGIYVILTPGFYITKKSQYMVLFTGSAAVINIILNLLLLPRLYIWGAAWATLFSYLVMALSIYLVSQKIYPIPIEWPRLGKIFIIFIALVTGYYLLNPAFSLRVVVAILYLIFLMVNIVRKEERMFIVEKAKNMVIKG